MILTLKVDPLDDYFTQAAHVRKLSRTALAQRILDIVVKDHMIVSVLDDEEDLGKAKIVPQARPPAQRLFSSVAPPRYVAPKKRVLTKADLREQLAQAVVNTGGRRITMTDRKAMVLDKLREADRPLSMGEIGGAAWWQATDALVDEGAVRRIESVGNREQWRGEPSVRYALQSSVADGAAVTPSRDDAATPATGDVDA